MIPVVFSTDHNYVMPAGVTICSLLLNKGAEDYDIYLLISKDVTLQDKKMLEKQILTLAPNSKITFIEMGNKYEGGYEVREISTACYYRLLIPWLLPHLDKVIYCDVDIIFKTDLRKLFELDLENKYVAGALPNNEEGWKSYEKYFRKIGIQSEGYINSGVLVINSQLQRNKELNKEYEKLSKKKFLYQDQDIINIVCRGKISYFSYRYNLLPFYYSSNEDLIKEVIIHYAGEKPWKTFTYAWLEWWKAYEKSFFYEIDFNHKVSQSCMNYNYQISRLLKKAKEKLKSEIKKHF